MPRSSLRVDSDAASSPRWRSAGLTNFKLRCLCPVLCQRTKVSIQARASSIVANAPGYAGRYFTLAISCSKRSSRTRCDVPFPALMLLQDEVIFGDRLLLQKCLATRSPPVRKYPAIHCQHDGFSLCFLNQCIPGAHRPARAPPGLCPGKFLRPISRSSLQRRPAQAQVHVAMTASSLRRYGGRRNCHCECQVLT